MGSDEPQISVVGAGLDGARHLTQEARASIGRARVVFHSSYNAEVTELVRAWNKTARIVDLDTAHYEIPAFRPTIYASIADIVVAAASDGPGVVLLEPGGPLVTDCVSRLVLQRAAGLGLAVSVVPGISSIEVALDVLALDPSQGLTVIQAQQLVLQRRRLDQHFPR